MRSMSDLLSSLESAAKTERCQAIMRLLSSIAVEEMALAHIVNGEAEKIQYVMGTLNPEIKGPEAVSVQDLFTVQDSVRKMMEEVLLREMMLHIKFENMLGALEKTSMQPKIP